MKRVTGSYHRTTTDEEEVAAFVPEPLPPRNPPLQIEGDLLHLLDRAQYALARLNAVVDGVPSVDWFFYGFIQKEAVLSSQIEGTQATLVDLLAHEEQVHFATSSPSIEVEDFSNYLAALAYARKEISNPSGWPLCIRLLNQTHGFLLQGVRGKDKHPGAVRTSQNWIGGTRPGNAMYVPPPAHLVTDCLHDLETYIHAQDEKLPPLIRIGLIHVQFETIHPHLDGNGRMGRLLIALLLEHWHLLSKPVLYLSLYFKSHQQEYYRRLTAVRNEGDWEGWLRFFLEGIINIADTATHTARMLFLLTNQDQTHLLQTEGTTIPTLQLLALLPHRPIVTLDSVIKYLNVSKPTAQKAINQLVKKNVLHEITGKKRKQVFFYKSYIDLLQTGTELFASTVRTPSHI